MMPSKTQVTFGTVLTFAFALILAGQKNCYDARAREKQQLATRRNELITELLPKLERFRDALDPITNASEATDEDTYRRELADALRETTYAVDLLSSGYDLIRTKTALSFDSTVAFSIDSLGREAESSRVELQKTLAAPRGKYWLKEERNPGEILAAFQNLSERVTRIEKALLSQR
jgi:hypothetical protein